MYLLVAKQITPTTDNVWLAQKGCIERVECTEVSTFSTYWVWTMNLLSGKQECRPLCYAACSSWSYHCSPYHCCQSQVFKNSSIQSSWLYSEWCQLQLGTQVGPIKLWQQISCFKVTPAFQPKNRKIVENWCTKKSRWRVVAHETVNTFVGARFTTLTNFKCELAICAKRFTK